MCCVKRGIACHVPSAAPLEVMFWWLQSHFQLLELNMSSVSNLKVSRMTAKGRIFREGLYLQLHPSAQGYQIILECSGSEVSEGVQETHIPPKER